MAEILTDFSTLSDRIVVALTIYGEARGEPLEGQVAVGCVIRNRWAAARLIKTYREICLAPLQFSCFNLDDPNRPILEKAAEVLTTKQPAGLLYQAEWIADGIISGACADVTHGAANYLTTHLYATQPPKWAVNKTILNEIGNHVFLA